MRTTTTDNNVNPAAFDHAIENAGKFFEEMKKIYGSEWVSELFKMRDGQSSGRLFGKVETGEEQVIIYGNEKYISHQLLSIMLSADKVSQITDKIDISLSIQANKKWDGIWQSIKQDMPAGTSQEDIDTLKIFIENQLKYKIAGSNVEFISQIVIKNGGNLAKGDKKNMEMMKKEIDSTPKEDKKRYAYLRQKFKNKIKTKYRKGEIDQYKRFLQQGYGASQMPPPSQKKAAQQMPIQTPPPVDAQTLVQAPAPVQTPVDARTPVQTSVQTPVDARTPVQTPVQTPGEAKIQTQTTPATTSTTVQPKKPEHEHNTVDILKTLNVQPQHQLASSPVQKSLPRITKATKAQPRQANVNDKSSMEKLSSIIEDKVNQCKSLNFAKGSQEFEEVNKITSELTKIQKQLNNLTVSKETLIKHVQRTQEISKKIDDMASASQQKNNTDVDTMRMK